MGDKKYKKIVPTDLCQLTMVVSGLGSHHIDYSVFDPVKKSEIHNTGDEGPLWYPHRCRSVKT
jgi:hypothetical protein